MAARIVENEPKGLGVRERRDPKVPTCEAEILE